MLTRTSTQLRRVAGSCRPASSLASLVKKHAVERPQALALAAPHQEVSWTFCELETRATQVVKALTSRGFKQGQVVVTDLPNSVENLLLQVACSRLNMAVATVKDEQALSDLSKSVQVQGAISHKPESFLATAQLPVPSVVEDDLNGSLQKLLAVNLDSGLAPYPEVDGSAALGYWSSLKALSNAEALDVMGAASKQKLSITSSDRVLVSITLCHAFGIGSAVGGAWMAGAAVVLPGASGIRGCGSPSQRAEASLSILATQRCSLLFADVHTLKALPKPPAELDLSAFRGGVCKVGSGTDFLDEVTEAQLGPNGELQPLEYAGVKLTAIGSKPKK